MIVPNFCHPDLLDSLHNPSKTEDLCNEAHNAFDMLALKLK